MRSPHLIGPLTEEEGVSHEPSESLVSEPAEESQYPIQDCFSCVGWGEMWKSEERKKN